MRIRNTRRLHRYPGRRMLELVTAAVIAFAGAVGCGESAVLDVNPPGPVSDFHSLQRNGAIALSWTNPSDEDFVGVIIRRGEADFPRTVRNGVFLCDCKGESFVDDRIAEYYRYYFYSAFAYDADGNLAAVRKTIGIAQPPGSLDVTFGRDYDADGQAEGYLVHGGDGGSLPYACGESVMIDASDRTLIAGWSGGDLTAWGLTADGRLDDRFGDSADWGDDLAGFVRLDRDRAAGLWDQARGAVLDDEGRLVIAGFSIDMGQPRMVVWRLGATGQLDLSFGSDPDQNGVRTGYSLPTLGIAEAVTVDRHRRIIVAGTLGGDLAVWRLTEDGRLDRGFGGDYDGDWQLDGVFLHSVAVGLGAETRGMDVVVDAEGRILVVGSAEYGEARRTAVWRLTDRGRLDDTFGLDRDLDGERDGFLVLWNAAGGYGLDQAGGLALGPEGEIYVAGTGACARGHDDLLVFKLTGSGTLDPWFGGPRSWHEHLPPGVAAVHDARGSAITVDAEGRLLIAGSYHLGPGADHDMALWRMWPDGTEDYTFGDWSGRSWLRTGAVISHDPGRGFGEDLGLDVAVDSRGRILVTGMTRTPTDHAMAAWRIVP